jgi:hypothetical protein
LIGALHDLLQDATAGDPISGLKWTRKSLRKLVRQLKRRQLRVSAPTISRLLVRQEFALRVNRKRLTREHHPLRELQMRYITRRRHAFEKAGLPVISVDCKKKELIGPFRNPGRTWRQTARAVYETDFASQATGKAIPYGIYDLQQDAAYIVVGTSHETAEFAVAAVRAWWREVGRHTYAQADLLLILADGGGGNFCRSWLWKAGLQRLANEFNLTITVTHYPPGASKWNPIEHRVFSPISQNWAGEPLISHETVLKFIRTTRTQTGLHCRARLDPTVYKTKLKLSAAEQAGIRFGRRLVRPAWNYTIAPRAAPRTK